MKVSSKSGSQSQVSSSPDSSTPQASDSPMDIIFAMLMQAASGVMPQIDDSQQIPDASDASDADGTIQQTTDSTSVENNPLFQQINMASAGGDTPSTDVQNNINQAAEIQQQISAATTQASSQANTLDQTKNAVDMTQQNANQLVNNNLLQTKQVDDAATMQSTQSAQPTQSQSSQTADTSTAQAQQAVDAVTSQMKQVTDAMTSQLKQPANPNATSTPDSSQAKQIVANSAPITTPVANSSGDTVDNSLLQQLSKATSAANANSNKVATDIKATPVKDAKNAIKNENNKENFLKVDNKIADTKTENTPLAINQKTSDDTNSDLDGSSDQANSMPKPEQLNSVSAMQMNQSTPVTEAIAQQTTTQNKYTDALTQLGSFINNQTMSMYGNSGQNDSASVAGNVSNASALPNYTMEALNTMPLYDLKVDIMPASVDSMMKEVYDAKIRIFPPELGHIIAKLKVGDNGANLSLTTENDRVKAIVEQNLPQLKENFQNANINLTNINVQTSSQSTVTDQQSGNNQRKNEDFSARNYTNDANNDQLVPAKEDSKSSNTIVDTYA